MIEFKIRPDKEGRWRRKGCFFRVIVVRDKRTVRKMYGRRCKGLAAYVRTNKTGPDLGVIVFPGRPGASLVAHEATHAALFFLAWQQIGQTYGRRIVYNSDEKVCLAVGNIVYEIAKGLFKKGVWK
jgi:hypothetical protein